MVIGIHSSCWEQTINSENCNFPVINVLEETLKCQQSNKVVYQGRIIGTGRASPGVILDYINKWILFSNDDSITIYIDDDDGGAYPVKVDKTCPPYLASPVDPNCIPKLHNAARTTSDVLSLMVIIVIIALLAILTVRHFFNVCKYNKTNHYTYKFNKCQV